MEDINIFVENENEWEILIYTGIYSLDIGLEFGSKNVPCLLWTKEKQQKE